MLAEKEMKEIPTLETERLVLRPFGLNDAVEIQRLAGEWDIADKTLNIPHPYKDGMAEEWISSHQDTFLKKQGVTFAITRKYDSSLVGAISLMNIAKGHQAELGYWIGTPYWNHGFCTEAGQVILQYAFLDLDLLRIHAYHFSRNPASGRVLEKLSMLHEGVRRKHARKWEKSEDLELYGILKDDWEILRSNKHT